jgi:phage-related protein
VALFYFTGGFMAQYDGAIRIATKITTKDAKESLASLEWTIKKSAKYMDELRSKMDALKDQEIPTKDYKDLQENLVSAGKELSKLIAEQERYNELGVTSGGAWDSLNEKVASASDKVDLIKEKMQALTDAGKDFTLGKDTAQYAAYERKLQYEEQAVRKAAEHYKSLLKTKDGYRKLGDVAKKSIEKINKTQKKSIGLLGSFGKQLKSIIAATFIFNTIRKAFSSLINGIKEGFENLYEGNEKFKNSVNSLKASALTLKNSLASAFTPLVEIAIPYIQRFVEWITKAVNLMGQFIAALTGKKTYTKAIKMTADDLKEEAESAEEAEEATKGYLSPLDEINKYEEKKDKSKEKEKDKLDPSNMFQEVPVDNKIFDFLQKIKDFLKPIIDYAQKLKDIFMQGFWDGLGDWKYRWESIKDSIASIKDSLIDIFTDPAVLAAADRWAQSVAYMIGSLAGSMASIGLTIATNLLGGIAKYLEQNKDRIKEYLISMFNIWEEVNYMFADFFQSIAYVFEAFASEQGQQLTANIIGIFTDAFMGITELASKFFREIANIIIQPFVDNKEGFRTALEGFLGVLAEVTGTIKQGIDETFDKLNEVYDAHFKPFFDSVAQGISNLVGSFLEFWNGTVQPILEEWAGKFDVLWKEHIQPFLNSVSELLGSIADLLKTLWEQVLQPFIQWIIDNVLPILMPIIESIYNTLVTIIGDIADLLTGFVNTVKGIIDLIVALINGDWSAAWEAAKSIVENVFNMIFSFVQTIIDSLLGVIDVGLQTILGIFETIFQAIFDFVSKIWNDIKEYTTSFFEWIGGHIDGALTDIKGVWDNIWDSFTEKVTSIWENIKNIVSGAIENIKNWVSGLFFVFDGVGSKAGSLSSRSGGIERTSYSRMAPSIYQNPAFASLSTTPIPRLATGAVIPANKEFLAVLGDQKHGTNVEAPLDTIKQAQRETLLEVLSSLGINGGNSGGTPVNLTLQVALDGKVLGQKMVDWGKLQQMATGINPYNLGTT